jgi:hypothetical protein
VKRSSRPRATAKLSESVHRQLSSYVLAAGAAGVGVLALARAAEAKIVYTPAHVTVPPQGGYCFDLNHDGTLDACLYRFNHSGLTTLRAEGSLTNDDVAGHVSSRGRGSALAILPGAKVGPARSFGPAFLMALGASNGTSRNSYWFGPWANGGKGVKNRYLGIRFKIGGRFHYGWARLNVVIDNPKLNQINRVLLTGYAYETILGKAIVAGKTKGPDVTTVDPASLGHLAAGASAIPAWRVKQTAATTH